MGYEEVKAAAESLRKGESVGSWRLAEAVLAEEPTGGPGLEERLEALAERLTSDGVRTPSEGTYTGRTLEDSRATAVAWAPPDRHPEASFSTHRAASRAPVESQRNREAPNGRAVLTALCAVARGEDVRRPQRADPEAWAQAVAAVRARASQRRPPTFLVAGNDVGLVLGRRSSLRGRPLMPDETTAAALDLSPEQKAALIADLADDPKVRSLVPPETVESFEEEGIERRATGKEPYDEDETRRIGRALGSGVARALEEDSATLSLRDAAGSLASAIVEREEFGIEHPDKEAEALERVERYLAAYKARGHLTGDDKDWLRSVGISAGEE